MQLNEIVKNKKLHPFFVENVFKDNDIIETSQSLNFKITQSQLVDGGLTTLVEGNGFKVKLHFYIDRLGRYPSTPSVFKVIGI
jgi:hypothetical protein